VGKFEGELLWDVGLLKIVASLTFPIKMADAAAPKRGGFGRGRYVFLYKLMHFLGCKYLNSCVNVQRKVSGRSLFFSAFLAIVY
jgi:hypothetical protein